METCEQTESVVTAFTRSYLDEVKAIAETLDASAIDRMAKTLAEVREAGGRVFFLGVGGSAANASHAVNDFRKIAGMECYAPSDQVAELTARINDDGWDNCYAEWLRGSRLCERDAVFVLSVGGGNLEKRVSVNLVESLKLALRVRARVLGVVGRDGGYTAQAANACVVVPTVSAALVTPHAEEFQGVVLHLLVSHPLLKRVATKWEQVR
ncbi:MAG: SIS domain-containing protein [Acidobacteriaceae bacterium]